MRDVVERIKVFNQSRDQHLVQRKYQLMSADAFAFYRGTCHLFYQDWPAQSPLNNAPATWLCGDLHWQNMGSYKGDNHLVYFNINDFDEAVSAPCTWDLARLLVSILIGATLLQAKDVEAQVLCAYFLERYAKVLASGRVHNVEEEETTGPVKDVLFQTRTGSHTAFLDDYTTLTDQGRRLNVDGKHAIAISNEQRAAVTEQVTQWGAKQLQPAHYTVLDVAQRIAGIGSLGVSRYIVLVEGKGSPDHNTLLDIKEEVPSSLQPYLTLRQPQWSSEAERAVTVQRWVQWVPPALLTTVPLEDKWYVLRALQPDANKIRPDSLGGKMARLQELVHVIAQVVASNHIQCAGQRGAADSYGLLQFAQAAHWRQPLLDYAQHYAEQVKQDYYVFRDAYDQGVFA